MQFSGSFAALFAALLRSAVAESADCLSSPDAIDCMHEVTLLQTTKELHVPLDTKQAAEESDQLGLFEVSLSKGGGGKVHKKGELQHVVKVQNVSVDPNASLQVWPTSINYGSYDCQCIGLDGVPGDSLLPINGQTVEYPANLGSRCAAWHLGNHPDCMKEPLPDWCSRSFCYVDPCKCGAQTPVLDPYLTDALWQNKRIFYSYATCGSEDSFTETMNPTACVNQKTQDACDALGDKCAWSLSVGCVGSTLSGSSCDLVRQNDQTMWGSWDCACQGIAGKEGSLFSAPLGVNYPATTGSTCGAWHKDVHPECTGDGQKPDWCSKRWCFVDPCTCGGGLTPKVDNVFPGGNFDGESLYYSFEACGNEDTYTPDANEDACSLQMTEENCTKNERCSWSFLGNDVGTVCRGVDYATKCAQTLFTKLSPAEAKIGAPWTAEVGILHVLLAAAAVLATWC